jgi:hypothetical protein
LPGHSLIAVYSSVCSSNDYGNSNFERIANPQKSGHCNWSASFDLLPMASGESERNHIFLAVAAPLAEVLDSLAQSVKEFGAIDHERLLLLPDQKHHEQISCLWS